MADRAGLGVLGFIFGGVTAVVMLVAVTVVVGHAQGHLVIDAPAIAVMVERPTVANPDTCLRSFVSSSAMPAVSIVCAPAGPGSLRGVYRTPWPVSLSPSAESFHESRTTSSPDLRCTLRGAWCARGTLVGS
jgi:hypothetical protein